MTCGSDEATGKSLTTRRVEVHDIDRVGRGVEHVVGVDAVHLGVVDAQAATDDVGLGALHQNGVSSSSETA